MHIELPTQKIQLLKNRVKLFTVDKDGKDTGKVHETTNMWVQDGYRYFWHGQGASIGGLSLGGDPINSASSDNATAVYISSSAEDITITTTELGAENRTSTTTRVPERAGVLYPNIKEVTRNGNLYFEIVHLFSFAFGVLDLEVNQVGMRIHVGGSGGIHCATRLLAPFTVTPDEQLLVCYSVFIPRESVNGNEIGTGIPTIHTTNVNINGNPATPTELTFRRGSGLLTGNANNNRRFYAMGDFHNQGGYFRNRTYINNASTEYLYLSTTDLTYSNNYRNQSINASIKIPPSPLGEISISQIDLGNRNNLLHTKSMQINFNPPLAKGEDDRIELTFTYTSEFDEVDF